MTPDIRSILTSDKLSVRDKAIAMLPLVCSLTADALHQDVLRLVSYASHENLVTNKRTLEQEVEKFWIYKVEFEALHMHKTLRHHTLVSTSDTRSSKLAVDKLKSSLAILLTITLMGRTKR
jgi:hypothetical protein